MWVGVSLCILWGWASKLGGGIGGCGVWVYCMCVSVCMGWEGLAS